MIKMEINNEEIFEGVYASAYEFEKSNKRSKMPLEDVSRGRKTNKKFNKKANSKKYSV